MIDLRSDTVTQPTAGMKDAMFSAPLGDDVFGEDPTINALQDRLAEAFGHEAGLFCSSGTMTNQLGIQVHTQPGDEVVCSYWSHVYNYEGGGIAKNSGSSVRLYPNPKISVDGIAERINPLDDHYARTTTVCVEDTVNKAGGLCHDFDELQAASDFCRSQGLNFHLDGARVMNALVAKKHDWKAYGQLFDSISICLSKGMGCPVGSVLLGSTEFIAKAHRNRKAMGGGMRQAGILAAAGLYALDHHVERMQEDHDHALTLANTLQSQSWVANVVTPESNIVVFELADVTSAEFQQTLQEKGILALPFGPKKMRFVTHLDLSQQDIAKACEILSKITTVNA